MNKYWSTLCKKLSPYVPGEQPQDQQYIKLNTNENPFPPSASTLQKIQQKLSASLRLYPDPEASVLKNALATHYGLQQDEVFVGNGSDEVLAFSFMAFYKDKTVTFPDITYSYYPVYCNLFDINSITFPLNERFEIDITNIPENAEGIIFPNPNAPTGIGLARNVIEKILIKYPDKVLIVDEAYVDFGGESSIPLVSKYPNLLVVQTFSKSRSLAGLRVGFAVGNPALIEGLNRVKDSFNSYPLDSLAICGAVAAIEDQAYFEHCCSEIMETREWVREQLSTLSFEVLPSQANFLFAKPTHNDAESVYQQLKQRGVLVRHFKKPRINEYLRITIGTKEEMQKFIDKL